MDHLERLRRATEKFCKKRKISVSRASNLVANDGKWLGNVLEGGAGFTVARFETVMARLQGREPLPPRQGKAA